jgi:hypothetical protein
MVRTPIAGGKKKERHTIVVDGTVWKSAKLCAVFMGVSLGEFVERGLVRNLDDMLKILKKEAKSEAGENGTK